MKCPYCDAKFDVEASKSYQHTAGNSKQDDMNWEKSPGSRWLTNEMHGLCTYECQSCGGEIIADENTAATSCPFCDNPVVMKGKLSGALRPDLVIPFKLDKKAAKEALKKHCSGKRLLPKVFKDENHIDEIKGIYVPFWLFDADAYGNVTYKATHIRSWSDSEYHHTQTMHYQVVRVGTMPFRNVPVDGSSKLDDQLMESIEPFDMTEAVDFQTAYLAGYFADQYDVDAETGITRANERIKASTEEAFRTTVSGYSTVLRESSSVQLKNSSAKYALLPVWLLNTTWRGKKYTFAMNGQTGKMVGDLPADQTALLKWFFSVFGIVTAVCFAIGWLIWLL
jgi:DNA-directed RNA polymerase subunit RPC12/RpoP